MHEALHACPAAVSTTHASSSSAISSRREASTFEITRPVAATASVISVRGRTSTETIEMDIVAAHVGTRVGTRSARGELGRRKPDGVVKRAAPGLTMGCSALAGDSKTSKISCDAMFIINHTPWATGMFIALFSAISVIIDTHTSR